MALWSRLPVEFDEGGLVPAAVTRERHKAHMRECYPMLYRNEGAAGEDRQGSFAAGFVAGAASTAILAALATFWLL